jgi:uncharacterized repeat protein (TIGR03803 family)
MRSVAYGGIICIVSLTACGGQGHNLPPPLPTDASRAGAPAFFAWPGASTQTLYGTTQGGGNGEACMKTRFDRIGGCGTVFALTLTGTERIVYAFSAGSDGRNPNSGVIADPSGTLYGTTAAGGGSSACAEGCGTAYAVKNSGSERVIYAFQGQSDGRIPSGRLLANGRGVLFGATRFGGDAPCRCGTIFKLAPSGAGYVKTTIYSFQGGSDGADPRGGLVGDRSGALYGTTIAGGQPACTGGCGTAFKLTPSHSGYTEQVLYRFQGGRDGAFPNALVKSRDGNFYGTTRGGGLPYCFGGSDCGTIFKLTTSGAHTVLFTFHGHNAGGDPTGTLLAGAAGTLYGTTQRNGAGPCCDPLVFKLTASGSGYAFTIVHRFNGSDLVDGVNGGLVAGPNGVLYGSNPNGGHIFQCFFNTGCGEIFALTPQPRGYSETVLYVFTENNQDGRVPNGDMLLL